MDLNKICIWLASVNLLTRIYEKSYFSLLADIQYSVVLAILFVAYSPAQIPSNMVIPSLQINFISRYLKDVFSRLLTMSLGPPRLSLYIPDDLIAVYFYRPSIYIGLCVVLWGLTSLLAGVRKKSVSGKLNVNFLSRWSEIMQVLLHVVCS